MNKPTKGKTIYYQSIPYQIKEIKSVRYTNFGQTYKCFIMNQITALGGLYIDILENGTVLKYSAD